MISVEVAYALPNKQKIVIVELDEGALVSDALAKSNMTTHFPDLEIDSADVGIFGKSVKRSQVLRNGDRIEIYRPLIADPKAVRKARAAKAANAK